MAVVTMGGGDMGASSLGSQATTGKSRSPEPEEEESLTPVPGSGSGVCILAPTLALSHFPHTLLTLPGHR